MTSKGDATPVASDKILILIADDEEPIVDMLAMFIEDLGYLPLRAQNGKQALDLAREHRPALIITDLMMPVMDGADLIKELHTEADAQGRDSPPIVLLTAGSTRVANQLPVEAMLRKPLDLSQLERVIRRLLKQ